MRCSLPSALRSSRALLLLAVLAAGGASAQVTVTDAWVRGTVAGQQATGAFMTLTATAPATLVRVDTPVAKVAAVHEMGMADGVMKMRAMPRLTLQPGKAVDLKPGGYHVMLMEIAQPLRAGETVPLTLVFEDASGKKSTVDVKATVRPLTATAAGPPAHSH
ncbi:MAG: copper chaperone PCu(A)C [Betaproteobacteria bacterium]